VGGLLGRIGQESGLIAIVAILALLIAVPVVVLRVRAGRSLWPSVWQTALEVGIVASLVGILALTVGAFGPGGSGQVNLVPFQSLVDSFSLGDFWVAIVLVDLAGNFLLYFPLGLFVALRFRALSIWTWALMVVALTTAIEILQGFVLNRSADVTDVLMNGLGGVAGFLVARTGQRLVARRNSGPQIATVDHVETRS
jgi:glycopeptide antibiotics resistance protein